MMQRPVRLTEAQVFVKRLVAAERLTLTDQQFASAVSFAESVLAVCKLHRVLLATVEAQEQPVMLALTRQMLGAGLMMVAPAPRRELPPWSPDYGRTAPRGGLSKPPRMGRGAKS